MSLRRERGPVDAWLRGLAKRAFRVDAREVSCAVRGFQVEGAARRERLERIGEAVLRGYELALSVPEPVRLAQELERASTRELLGFGFEGAGMGLALLDALSPWSSARWSRFAEGAGAAHVYMLHVGAGLARARLRRSMHEQRVTRAPFHPLLGALVADGYGFHEGYFRTAQVANGAPHPRRVAAELRPAFDQGLGRSLWFSRGMDAAALARTIALFAPERQADLWSGVGLAAAYAGGVDEAELRALRDQGAGFEQHLAQGAAFAAEARERAGNAAPHTTLACELLCGVGPPHAAEIVRAERAGLASARGPRDYELWRARVRVRFAGRPA